MSKIDRADIERVIDDLETKMEQAKEKVTKKRNSIRFGYEQEGFCQYYEQFSYKDVLAYQYAIDRLRELLT